MKRKIIISASLLFVFGLLNFTYARQNVDPMPNKQGQGIDKSLEKKEAIQEKKEEMLLIKEEKKEQVKEKLCERVEMRAEERLNSYSKRFEVHKDLYAKFITKLEEIVLKLEVYEVDLTKLKEDLETFKLLVAEYQEMYEGLVSKLRYAHGLACSEEAGEYRGALNSTKEELNLVRQKRVEIMKFYAQSLRQEIASIRQQISVINSGSEPAEAEEE